MRSRPLSRDTGLLKMALTSPDGLPQDATSVAAAIAQGAVSADEILAEAQQRLATAHDQYNVVAWWVTRPQAAKPGPFEGVPIVLKDNEAWPGVPLTFGSNALGSSPTSSPSRYAAQLAGLGFVVIAKTTMPELGLTATTEGHRFGATEIRGPLLELPVVQVGAAPPLSLPAPCRLRKAMTEVVRFESQLLPVDSHPSNRRWAGSSFRIEPTISLFPWALKGC